MSSDSELPKGWTECRLGEIVDIFDGPHATPPKKAEGPVFLGIASLNGGRIDPSASDRLSEDDFIRWTRRITPRAGDIVFSYETRIGAAAQIPDGLRCCLGRRMGLLRAKSDGLLPRYMLYAYLGPQFQSVLRAQTIHGSTVDRIPLRQMANFPIVLPPLWEQQRIAQVLGALDDKIESNRRLWMALEELVRLNASAPDDVGDAVPLHSLALEHRRKVDNSALPYIGLDDMPRGSTVLNEWKASGAPTGTSREFRRYDVLFGKLRPYFRKAGVALIDGRCSTEIVVLRPTRPEYFGVVVAALASSGFSEHCVAVSTGTRMPRAEWSNAGEYNVLVPSDVRLHQINDLALASYRRIGALVRENQTLAQTRDELLLKLVSGQIRVAA